MEETEEGSFLSVIMSHNLHEASGQPTTGNFPFSFPSPSAHTPHVTEYDFKFVTWTLSLGFYSVGALRQVHGYNRMAGVARGRILLLLQDDQLPPENCAWLEDLSLAFRRWPRLGGVGLNFAEFWYPYTLQVTDPPTAISTASCRQTAPLGTSYTASLTARVILLHF